MPALASGELQARHGGRAHARTGSRGGCESRIGRVLLHETVPSVPGSARATNDTGRVRFMQPGLHCRRVRTSARCSTDCRPAPRRRSHRAGVGLVRPRPRRPAEPRRRARPRAGGAACPRPRRRCWHALDDAARVLDESLAPARPRYFAFVGSSGLEVGGAGRRPRRRAYDVNLAIARRRRRPASSTRRCAGWAEFVGYPATGGAFTSGGMISNLTALVAARERALPGRPRDRPRRAPGRPLLLGRGPLQRAARGRGARASARATCARSPMDDPRRMRRRRGGRASTPTSRPASRRSPWSRRRARRSPARSTRSASSPTSAPSAACGCTSTAPTGCRPPPRPPRPASSRGSSAPTRSRSMPTSGCTCRRPAASSWCATGRALERVRPRRGVHAARRDDGLNAVDTHARVLAAVSRAQALAGVPRRTARRRSATRSSATSRSPGASPRSSARTPSSSWSWPSRSSRSCRSATCRRASPTSTRTTWRSSRRCRTTGASTSRRRSSTAARACGPASSTSAPPRTTCSALVDVAVELGRSLAVEASTT